MQPVVYVQVQLGKNTFYVQLLRCMRGYLAAAQALGGLRCRAALCEPLLGCPGVQCQGMEPAFKLAFQLSIKHSVPFQELAPTETLTNCDDLEVRFGACRDVMCMALVRHLQEHGGEGGL